MVLGDGTAVEGELVVEATGQQARSLGWLADLGYPPPPVSEVGIDMRYVSRLYRRIDRPERGWKAALVIGRARSIAGSPGPTSGLPHETLAAPWSIAAGGDFAYPGTRGRKPPGTDLLNRYMDRVFRAAQHDDHVMIRATEVLGLLRRPEALLAPAFVLRVLRADRPSRRPISGAVTPAADAAAPDPKSLSSSGFPWLVSGRCPPSRHCWRSPSPASSS